MKRMVNEVRDFGRGVPLPLAAAYICGFGFVAWDQSHWWRTKEDYGFGWLAPLFVAYVLHIRWGRLKDTLRACRDDDNTIAAGGNGMVRRIAVWCTVAAGALLFLAGSWYRASFGASHMGTLFVTLGMIGMVAACVALYLNDGYESGVTAREGTARQGLVSLLFFPFAVWLLSAPMLSGVENLLNRLLLENIMSAVAAGFRFLGLEFQREGNVIVTPGGRVGVLDACSGIRSLMGCLFAGSFIGAALLERLSHKLALLAAAVVFALAANLARAGLLALAVHRHGIEAVEGVWHDLAGWGVLLATVAGLWLAALRLRKRESVENVSK